VKIGGGDGMGGCSPKSKLCPVRIDIIIACKIVYMSGSAEIKLGESGTCHLLQKERFKLTFTYAM
jgi:hypothetical protein